jgi:steroid 5-alpha reductase family enzyme
MTLLEKGLHRSKGNKYAAYERKTSAFFPLPPRV